MINFTLTPFSGPHENFYDKAKKRRKADLKFIK